MTVTALDQRTALIVIDLQKGIVSYPTAHPIDKVIEQACALVDAFRRHELPVVLVTCDGIAPGRNEQARGAFTPTADFAGLIPQLHQQPQDHTVVKRTWGAFTGTDLAGYLQQINVTQVVVIGVATSIGVESTARQAHELGFNVTLAIDAMTDLNLATHDNSIAHIFPRMGETGTTRAIIDLLDKSRA